MSGAPVAGSEDRDWLIDGLGRVVRHASGLLARYDRLEPHWPADRRAGHYDKLLGETAILLLAAHRAVQAGAEALRGDVEELASALAGQARGERATAMLMRSRRNRAATYIPHVVLTACGFPDPAFARLLDRAAAAPDSEAAPFRLAERLWFAALEEGDGPLGDPLTFGSIYHGDHSVFEMDRMDLYAITHWIIYVTDFGRVTASERVRTISAGLIDAGLAWQLGDEDLDLLGELLMAARLLRLPATPPMAAGWRMIAESWSELGFLPSPSFVVNEFEALEGGARDAYVAAHSYHTNYVFGLLCAATLLLPGPPDGVIAEPVNFRALAASARSAAEQGWKFCGGRPDVPLRPAAPPPLPEARWMSLLDAAGDPDLRREIELVQAVRRYDLARLAWLLHDWLEESTTIGPLVTQAIEFVVRQQVPEGAIGAQFLDAKDRKSDAALLVTAVFAGLLDDIVARLLRYASGTFGVTHAVPSISRQARAQ